MEILIKNQQRYKRLNKTKIAKAARKILILLEQPLAELSILFVGDRRMSQLNATFRGIHKSTDVLSFEVRLPIGDGQMLGDVVINTHRAAYQARMAGIGFYDEVNRLLIHGILHLLGYDHERSRHSARIMKKKEQEILNAFKGTI
jgi:probable rRNA maturation factor